MSKLIPIHIHSEFSLLDGTIRVEDLVNYAKENELPAIAITDHGVMYSAIEFYEKAKDAGINPLIGCEFYVHDGDVHVKDSANNPLYHLILIAKDKKGYANLIKLVSVAWCEGFYYKPRINFELLQQYHEGLVCSSACLGGEVLQHLLNGEKDKAKATALKYKELFGDDYYIELQDHNLEDQKRTNPDLIKIAKELGIKMIITNDSHYLRKEDADAQDTLLCLQTNADKDDPNRFHFPNNEFYLKSKDEMRKAFSWMDDETFEECVAREMAEEIGLKLPASRYKFNNIMECFSEFKGKVSNVLHFASTVVVSDEEKATIYNAEPTKCDGLYWMTKEQICDEAVWGHFFLSRPNLENYFSNNTSAKGIDCRDKKKEKCL